MSMKALKGMSICFTPSLFLFVESIKVHGVDEGTVGHVNYGQGEGGTYRGGWVYDIAP